MIDYQPAMCIASVEVIREEPSRNWLEIYVEHEDRLYRWNVSDRYLQYLREEPSVPLCPIIDW